MEAILIPEVIVPIVVVILGGVGWAIRRYFESRNGKAEIRREAANGDAPAIQAGRDRLRLRIDNAQDPDLSLWVVTFRPREPASPVNKWMDDQAFTVKADSSGTFYLHLLDIQTKLREPAFPFKTYLSIPVERRHEFYGHLADAEATVTGRGEEDPDHPGNWRIWFLFPGALLHPDVEDLFRLNMKCDGA